MLFSMASGTPISLYHQFGQTNFDLNILHNKQGLPLSSDEDLANEKGPYIEQEQLWLGVLAVSSFWVILFEIVLGVYAK